MTVQTSHLATVLEAAQRIAPHAHHTPVLTCEALDKLAGRRLYFKCESFQKVGAFKFRGACNAVMKLSVDEASRGVVTHSSGNHAQALALAARIRGIDAHIVMPTSASAVKRRAVRGYGARVIDCEPTLEARDRQAHRVVEETGATLIPPYDHPDIIAGQGTVALEMVDQIPGLDVIVAPVGGGGLISGICAAVGRRDIRVLGSEPAGADDAARSKAAGRLLLQTAPQTICDGLLTSLGQHTWPWVRDGVERILVVDDASTVAAMRLLFERAKLLVEPSSATALAAVLSPEFRSLAGCRHVGIVLSGGNVDLDHLPF